VPVLLRDAICVDDLGDTLTVASFEPRGICSNGRLRSSKRGRLGIDLSQGIFLAVDISLVKKGEAIGIPRPAAAIDHVRVFQIVLALAVVPRTVVAPVFTPFIRAANNSFPEDLFVKRLENRDACGDDKCDGLNTIDEKSQRETTDLI